MSIVQNPRRRASLRNVEPGRLGCKPGTARVVLDALLADEPSPVEQVRDARDKAVRKIVAIVNMGPLDKDWSARLAADWKHVEHNLVNLGEALVRRAHHAASADQNGAFVATAPLLSELTELSCVELPDWRQALAVHAEDELALFDAEMAVAL